MCGFISISINSEVKNATFLYKTDHEKGEYKSEYQKYCVFVSITASF